MSRLSFLTNTTLLGIFPRLLPLLQLFQENVPLLYNYSFQYDVMSSFCSLFLLLSSLYVFLPFSPFLLFFLLWIYLLIGHSIQDLLAYIYNLLVHIIDTFLCTACCVSHLRNVFWGTPISPKRSVIQNAFKLCFAAERNFPIIFLLCS